MSKERHEIRSIEAYELPKTIRQRLPEAQKDYEEYLRNKKNSGILSFWKVFVTIIIIIITLCVALN